MIERVQYGIRWPDGYVSHESEDKQTALAMLADHDDREHGTVVTRTITITEWKEAR